MKLSEAKQAYEDLSGLASTVCRQLGFAGIGVIWILHNNPSFSLLPNGLRYPLLFICGSLGLDIIGYTVSTIIWYCIYRKNHKPDNEDDKVTIIDKESINNVSWIIWFIKIVLIIVAYIQLAVYLFT